LHADHSVGDYLVRFRAIAISTGYSENDLTHHYIKGLKGHIHKAVLPLNQSQKPSPIGPTSLMSSKHSSTWRHHIIPNSREEKQHQLMSSTEKDARNVPTFSKIVFPREENEQRYRSRKPMEIDRAKQQCHFCGRFGHIQKDCYRKLGLCLHCGKSGHMGRIVQREIHQEMGLRFMQQV